MLLRQAAYYSAPSMLSTKPGRGTHFYYCYKDLSAVHVMHILASRKRINSDLYKTNVSTQLSNRPSSRLQPHFRQRIMTTAENATYVYAPRGTASTQPKPPLKLPLSSEQPREFSVQKAHNAKRGRRNYHFATPHIAYQGKFSQRRSSRTGAAQ